MTRNVLVILLAGFMLVACGGGDNGNGSGNGNGSIDQKIAAYEKQVSDLKAKIAELRKQQKKAGIKTEELLLVNSRLISREMFEHFITVSGTVEGVNQAAVTPETSGQVSSIRVKDGEKVKRGQVLVELESSILRNSLKEIETSLALAETIYQRRERLWNKKIGSEIEYLQAKNNRDSLVRKADTIKSQLAKTVIRAPFSGIVDRVLLKKGEMAGPGTVLLNIVDPSSLYINTDVSEAYMTVIGKGDTAEVTFPSMPGKSVAAPVVAVGTIINKENRTFRVKIKLENPENIIKSNIMARVRLKDYETAAAITVPTQVIKNDIEGSFVYVIKKEEVFNVAMKRYVKTGLSWMGTTEITEGLKDGDKVITEGFSIVKSGQKVRLK